MDHKRARSDSASTFNDREMSVFSDRYVTAYSSARTSPDIGTLGEEIVEIDKETFEANIRHIRADSGYYDGDAKFNALPVKIINGSTYGGVDPLHQLLKKNRIEPRFWTQSREEAMLIASYNPPAAKRAKKNSKKNVNPPDPKFYDDLPLSREAVDRGMTCGFDVELDPVSGEEFWAELKAAWDISMRYETVGERRDVLDVGPIFSGRETPDDFEMQYADELMVQ